MASVLANCGGWRERQSRRRKLADVARVRELHYLRRAGHEEYHEEPDKDGARDDKEFVYARLLDPVAVEPRKVKEYNPPAAEDERRLDVGKGGGNIGNLGGENAGAKAYPVRGE